MKTIPTLKFDIPGMGRNIRNIEYAYTELGAALKSMMSKIDEGAEKFSVDMKEVDNNSEKATRGIPEGSPISLTDETNFIFHTNEYERQDRRISEALSKFSDVELGKLFGGGVPVVADSALKGSQQSADNALKNVQDAKDLIDFAFIKLMKSAEKIPALEKDLSKKLAEFNNDFAKEVEKSQGDEKSETSIKGIVGKIAKKATSKFAGMLFDLFSLGYREKNRKQAELGEMINVFQGAVDSGMSKRSGRLVEKLWQWSENAQWFYGVSREGVQKAAALLVNTGMSTEKMLSEFNKGLGEVGDNVIITSLALDKHFRMSEGTTMEYAVNLMENYGMSIKKATESFADMAFYGQRASLGTENFVRTVINASGAMSSFGINVESVAAVSEKVVDYYKKMGLQDKYIGRQLEGVVVNIFEAFVNLNDNLKIVLMRDMYKDEESSGYALLIQYADGLNRVKDGGNDDFLKKLINSFARYIQTQFLGGRERKIMALKNMLGVRTTEAAFLTDYANVLEELGESSDATKAQWKKVQNAFKTERESVNSLQVVRREIISGLSLISESLMMILTDIICILLVGIKSFSSIGYAILNKTTDPFLRIWEEEVRIWGQMKDHWGSLMEGAKKVGGVLGNQVFDVVRPLVDLFSKTLTPPRMPSWEDAKMAALKIRELTEAKVEDTIEKAGRVGQFIGSEIDANAVKDIVSGSRYAEEGREMVRKVTKGTPAGEFLYGAGGFPLLDRFMAWYVERSIQAELRGETEWAKKNPEKVKEKLRKIKEGYTMDPFTGELSPPKEQDSQVRLKEPNVTSSGQDLVPTALDRQSEKMLPQQ